MEFKVVEGRLTFEGLEIGQVVDGIVRFDFDTLRHIVMISTRFATGRKIEPRTLQELREEAKKRIRNRHEAQSEEEEREDKLKKDVSDTKQLVKSFEDNCDRQNQEIDEWRSKYLEASRALQEFEKGA
jgi:hypothetical protein